MVSLSRQLVREVRSFHTCALKSEAIEKAKDLFLDTLGVSLAATHTPEAQKMRSALEVEGALHRQSGALLLGLDGVTTAADAALYNGTLAHALELDDFGGADHSGAVVFPAALAAAGLNTTVTGIEFLTASVAGYEVARRALEAAGAYREHNANGGWHSTATCGAAGAAMAAGLILELTEDQLVSALGFALTMTGGTWAFNTDGAMSKRLHPGWAASLGVKAALWAQADISGPEYAFEAEWGGFFNTYAKGGAAPEQLLDDVWGWPRILRSGVKPYPCCRDNHSVVDVMLELHQKLNGDLTPIKAIEIRCIPEMYKMLANAAPKNMVEAQLSMPFCAAVALVDGKVSLQRFLGDFQISGALQEVIDSIKLRSDATLGDDAEPVVRAAFVDGAVFEKSVPFAKGDHKNPLSYDELYAKFETMCEMGRMGNRSSLIAAEVRELDQASSLAALMALLRSETVGTALDRGGLACA